MRKIVLVVLGAICAGLLEGQIVSVFNASKDNTIFSQSGSLSAGADAGLFIGRVGSMGGNALRRALVQFDISSLNQPLNANITNASVTLTRNRGNTGQTVNIHRLTGDWGEAGSVGGGGGGGSGGPAQPNEVTWTHQNFNSNTWTSNGGDFNASSGSTTVNAGATTWSSAGTIADVEALLANPGQNFGWIFIGPEAVSSSAARFASKEHGTSINRPKLSITYDCPNDDTISSLMTGTYQAKNDLTADGTVANGVDVVLQGGNSVILDNNFEVSAGGTLEANIKDDCAPM